MITVRPATEKDYVEYFRELPFVGMHLLAFLEDDKVLALAGFFKVSPNTYMFFRDSVEGFIQQHPVLSVKAAKRLLKFADEKGWRVVSYPDEKIEKSVKFLEHFGFEYLEDGLYVRRTD